MCGIIGILGSRPVAPLLLDGLRRLEYRGYDSAGMATLVDGVIERQRAAGKIERLVERLEQEPLGGVTGIGHTRLATRARATEASAHPHANGRLALVHHGIIENHRDLRTEQESQRYRFVTATDRETVVHLVGHHLEQGLDPIEAVKQTLHRLEGAFAFAIIFAGHHDLMIGARRGSPLAVGYGEDGELYLGSDALALAPLTNRICYLEEGDWVVLQKGRAQIFDAAHQPVERPIVQSALSGAAIGKGHFRHFMQKRSEEHTSQL